MDDPSILVAGEALIDFLPDRPGPLAGVESFSRRAGGAPANVAVALARLDATPYFRTRIGDDPFGDVLAGTLADHGIPDRFVERDPDAKTSLAFVAHGEGGEPEFSFYRDGTADTRMRPGVVPDAVLEGVDWVYVGGVPLADEPSRSATRDLAARARGHGCAVAFDPNARPELWTDGDFAAEVGDLLGDVDMVKATPEDLHAAGFEGTDGTLADAVLDAGPHTLLLTRGEAGATAYSTAAAPWGAVTTTHPGYDVDPADTTGAGDAFVAGVLAALAGGERDPDEFIAFANAVAAVAITAPGAMTALPDAAAVREFRAGRDR